MENKSCAQNRKGISHEGRQTKTPARKTKKNVTASGVETRIIIADFKTYRSELYRESEVQVILYFSVQILSFSFIFPF
jgi:hypothetical protein